MARLAACSAAAAVLLTLAAAETAAAGDQCPVTGDDAKRDARELVPFLQSGSLEFIRRYSGKYGYQKEGECALQPFMIELKRLDPDDVTLTTDHPVPRPGHIVQSFPDGSPDTRYKGYDIVSYKMLAMTIIEKLENHATVPSYATAEIDKYLDVFYRQKFADFFKKNIGDLPYALEPTEHGELIVKRTRKD